MLQKPEYCMLSKNETSTRDTLYLSITRETCAVLDGIGPTDNPRLLLIFTDQKVMYTFQVYFTAYESGDYAQEIVCAKLDQLVPKSGYILCPGLQCIQYDLFHKSKKLRIWQTPFKRIDSSSCEMFHIPKNDKLHQYHQLIDMCASCKKLYNQYSLIKRRNDDVSTEIKLSRMTPNSRYPLSLLSPNSREIRNKCVVTERKALKKKVEKYDSEWKCNLSDEQSLELAKIMQVIDEKYQCVLEDVFIEADQNQRGEQLRREWNQDRSDHLDFWDDQVGNGL